MYLFCKATSLSVLAEAVFRTLDFIGRLGMLYWWNVADRGFSYEPEYFWAERTPLKR